MMADLSRHRPKATRDRWKFMPLPREYTHITIDRTYHPGQWDRISLGLVPQEMEDKWFIYEEDYWIYIHRSWTGVCLYKVRFENTEDSLQIAEAYANRNPEQYSNTDSKYDSQFIAWMIDYFLLGKKDALLPSNQTH